MAAALEILVDIRASPQYHSIAIGRLGGKIKSLLPARSPGLYALKIISQQGSIVFTVVV
jgi:hypothetical protein